MGLEFAAKDRSDDTMFGRLTPATRRTLRARPIATLLLAAVVLAAAAPQAMPGPDAEPQSSRPRLVLLIVVDQLRYDLLARYREHFVPDGFQRFIADGATYTQARYLHAATDTCPGHAVIATGSWGDENGIVANRWYDRGRQKDVECAGDGRTAVSKFVLRPRIGDVIAPAGKSAGRIVAVSGKRGSALILGGERGGAYWPDQRGSFVNDGTERLPDWLLEFNRGGTVDSYFGQSWKRLLPDGAYASLGAGSFPHALPAGASAAAAAGDFHDALQATPFGDEILAALAVAAIRGERLGDDEDVDLLAISFSAADLVGHRYGPDSPESMDTIVRLDRQIAQLLETVDAAVGLRHTIVVLTADHGIAPLPEVARRHAWGKGARRVSEPAITAAAERALTDRYGKAPGRRWIALHSFPNVYIDESGIRAKGIPGEEAERIVADAVESSPGIRRAVTRTKLVQQRKVQRAGGAVADPAALNSFHPARSGDVVYMLDRYAVMSDEGSNHGSDWSYDTRVPLMWLAPGIQPGHYHGSATPADIAPTLYAMLGIDAPATGGRVLSEMLKPVKRKPDRVKTGG
jgi:Type I phosphodiesterase / nucleotide pyrophosphatase